MITKSDFLLSISEPMHLWAMKHNRVEISHDDPFGRYLKNQGFQIEELAEKYIGEYISRHYENPRLLSQQTFSDGEFLARIDALIFDPVENVYDLFEIKSSTSIHNEHIYDTAFQALVSEADKRIRDVFIIHINKDYLHQGEIDISNLFVVESMREAIASIQSDLKNQMQIAKNIASADNPDGILGCQKPQTCICPTLCHPNLPENNIYAIARIGSKASLLREKGILAIQDIPDDFPLTKLQRTQVDSVKLNAPVVDMNAIKKELDGFEYPLHFLDYETVNPGIPIFDGYHPYEHIVFQYSLLIAKEPDDDPIPFEYISIDHQDPGPKLLENLARQISENGTILVWNKSFEAKQNQLMATRYPEFDNFLQGVNHRLFDLMEIFRKGMYIHPGFQGSTSIKKVLPVLAPEINYQDLIISEGRDAMVTWWKLFQGDIDIEIREKLISDLKEYSKMDTYAIHTIWRYLDFVCRGEKLDN